ncbi:MAG: hypothetical protein E5Y74_01700 [Mesorhizobium sp.]|nr:MAG: hypothetical protein E5Y74_01700 [Mesorhizobium sp.]
MRYDGTRGDWFSLPKPWLELRQAMRDSVVHAAGEIRTYDGGHLIRVDGVWEVMESGTHNDADVILNVLRKAN